MQALGPSDSVGAYAALPPAEASADTDSAVQAAQLMRSQPNQAWLL